MSDKNLINSSYDSNLDNEEDKMNSLSSRRAQKHKRRSKGDEHGRDYTCGCGKSYLSYPALYTHIKTKHSGTTPTGTTAPKITTGRCRGRPHKV